MFYLLYCGTCLLPSSVLFIFYIWLPCSHNFCQFLFKATNVVYLYTSNLKINFNRIYIYIYFTIKKIYILLIVVYYVLSTNEHSVTTPFSIRVDWIMICSKECMLCHSIIVLPD